MAFVQSFYDKSSVLRINVMVVDDDPVFLQVMCRMLEKSKYRDPSLMEITVIAAKDSIEALSTLKIQRNNIDLIITDYYMPGMNGLQLKKQITQEFGNLPVIVISSDPNKEEESLICGAMCFIPKPIKPADLTKIYQLALTYKRNGKSILLTDQTHKDTDVSIPQQIQLPPEEANVLKINKKKKYSSRSGSRSVNSTNGSCVSTDGLRTNRKRKPNGTSGDEESRPSKKSKVTWTDDLHDLFLQAIRHIGLDKAVPKKILEFMNISYLTRENVASHLQKYRIFLRKVAEQGVLYSNLLSGRGIDSIFSHAHIREPYQNYYTPSTSWYDTSLNNRSLYSKPSHALGQSSGHGLGQSRLLSNTREPVRVNQTPYNYMNRSTTYEPLHIGSNLTLPIKSNLNYQPSQNEGIRSFFKPPVMTNKTGQTSQVLGIGQHGLSATNGNSFNNDMMSSYGSLTPNQPELSSFGSLTPNQPGLSSFGSLPPYQPGLNNFGSLTPNQLGLSSFESLTPSQPGLSSFGSLTPSQPGLSSFGSLPPYQPELSSFGSVALNQPGLSSFGSVAPTQLGLSSFGSVTLNQPGLSNFGSLTPNQLGLSSFGSLTPNQSGASHFSYGMQSILNNENEAYNLPQTHADATTQPNLDIPQLENLNLYDLGSINALPCETSNFQLDHNQQQGEAASTKFELPANFLNEMNQMFCQDDGDWTNINQGNSNGDTSNTFAAPETNSPILNINPNQNQEQDVPVVDWSLLDPQDLVADEFMDSLFNNYMN